MHQNTKLDLISLEQEEFIGSILDKLEKNYIKESVIKSNKELLRQELLLSLKASHESKESLAQDLSSKLVSIIKDKHMGIRVQKSSNLIEQQTARLKYMEEARYGIGEVKLINDIGYLELTAFVWPRGFAWAERCEEPLKIYVREAFSQLNQAKALIIDLRSNEGGSPEMVAAISSFILAAHTPLNEFHWRDPHGNMYETIKNWAPFLAHGPATLEKTSGGITVEKFQTIDEETTFGLKSNLKNVPIIVLTSSKTFSAAEEFAYNLKQLKRAIIIGDTTAGGANPWHPIALQDGFELLVPNGEAINPISKTNWEGKGVEPDVKVPSEQALEEAIKRLKGKL